MTVTSWPASLRKYAVVTPMTPLPRTSTFMLYSRKICGPAGSRADMDAMETVAEAGQHLVGDGAVGTCHIVDGLVGIDQVHQIAGPEPAFRQGRNIEDDRIHRYA